MKTVYALLTVSASAFALAGIFALAACTPPGTDPWAKERFEAAAPKEVEGMIYRPTTWTDPETGCKYLSVGQYGTFIPRLNTDGKPWCEPGLITVK